MREFLICIRKKGKDSSTVLKELFSEQVLGPNFSVLQAEVKDLGFVHPDGEVYECAPPPEGLKVFVQTERLEGVYQDCSARTFLAVPVDEFSRASESPRPTGTMIWRDNQWKAIGDKIKSDTSGEKPANWGCDEFGHWC